VADNREPPRGWEPGEGPGEARGGEQGGAQSDELHAAPPFLTWRAIYTIVLGALALQVVLYAALTALYRP
jgi:hypothetical protein